MSGILGTRRHGGQPRVPFQAKQRQVPRYPALGGTQRDSGLLWRLWHGVKGDEGGGFRAGLFLFSLGGSRERLFSRAQQKTRVTGSLMGGSSF